jgi:hypothetical protein
MKNGIAPRQNVVKELLNDNIFKLMHFECLFLDLLYERPMKKCEAVLKVVRLVHKINCEESLIELDKSLVFKQIVTHFVILISSLQSS